MKTKIGMLITFIVLLLAFGARSIQAELIAYDQFADYTDGVLAGQGEGFGWGTNNWTGVTNHIVSSAGDLNYGGLETYGGGGSSGTSTALGWWQVSRTLATPVTNSGTYYLGFLLQPLKSGTSYSKHAGLRMDGNAGDFRVGGGIWDNLANWALRRRDGGGDFGYGTAGTSISKSTNITHFVIKFVFDTAGNESADLYVNPADTAALAGSGNASYTFSQQWPEISTITVVRNSEGSTIGNMAYDEIRLGTTPEDMFDPIYRPPLGTVIIIR